MHLAYPDGMRSPSLAHVVWLRRSVAAAALACLLVTGGAAAPGAARAAGPTLAHLVGQRLVVAFHGTTASRSLRVRIRTGRIGGVILFGSNITSESQLKALTSSLRAAATAGGRPTPIIAVDQEGGLVRRLGWAPPKRSAQEMGQLRPAQVQSIGAATAARLRADGINVDLAPVADVPDGPADFIWQQHRAFSTSRYRVARDAPAFAQGLENGHVWPTFKHFPGLGQATVSTDDALVRIDASARTLVRRLLPYRVAINRPLNPIVMLSTAVYPALDNRAAAWSPQIIRGLLRKQLGFGGVTITDSLDPAAAVRHATVTRLALKSAAAGADLVLITGSGATSVAVYDRLLAAARAGTLRRSQLQASYTRILALKSNL
jgi:beta-N-acetylhexosaminidase